MVDEDFIKEEDVVVIMTSKGFVKRLPVEEYRSQGRGGKGVRAATLRDEDLIEHVFVASTHDHVLAVSSVGKAYWIKVHEIESGSKTSKGESIKKTLPLEENEEITSFTPFKEFDEDTYLFMVTRDGVAKQVNLPLFKNAKKRGITAIILDEGDVLHSCVLVKEDEDCMIVTKHGKGLRFSSSSVRAMGRSSRGVRGIRLIGDDQVVGLLKVQDDKRILLITENGQGKQITFDSFRAHGRGTMGQKIYTFREKTGYIVRALSVNDDNDIMIITTFGQSIRIPVATISIQGAYASGVVIARLKKNDSIQALAVADAEKDEDGEDDEYSEENQTEESEQIEETEE
jgi:DNA gyrase subunit A